MSSSSWNDFVKLQRLGKGAFGVVHKARRVQDGRVYVVKSVDTSQLDAKAQQDAVGEVQILASLESEFIVKYYDSFVEEEQLCIVMEFCEKGDLYQRIKSRGSNRLFPEKTIWRWFIQTALGMYHIHSKKVLHRDLKSMNLFLDANDNVKIGDLGVARVLGGTGSFAQTMVGTPYYMSPELCENKPYNELSDVWALGCILYELCTLKHPFDARNQGALILKIIRGKYAPPKGQYSAGLRRVLAACLRKDPHRRPNIAQILSSSAVHRKAVELDLVKHYPQLLVQALEARNAAQKQQHRNKSLAPSKSKRALLPGKKSSGVVGRKKSSVTRRTKPASTTTTTTTKTTTTKTSSTASTAASAAAVPKKKLVLLKKKQQRAQRPASERKAIAGSVPSDNIRDILVQAQRHDRKPKKKSKISKTTSAAAAPKRKLQLKKKQINPVRRRATAGVPNPRAKPPLLPPRNNRGRPKSNGIIRRSKSNNHYGVGGSGSGGGALRKSTSVQDAQMVADLPDDVVPTNKPTVSQFNALNDDDTVVYKQQSPLYVAADINNSSSSSDGGDGNEAPPKQSAVFKFEGPSTQLPSDNPAAPSGVEWRVFSPAAKESSISDVDTPQQADLLAINTVKEEVSSAAETDEEEDDDVESSAYSENDANNHNGDDNNDQDDGSVTDSESDSDSSSADSLMGTGRGLFDEHDDNDHVVDKGAERASPESPEKKTVSRAIMSPSKGRGQSELERLQRRCAELPKIILDAQRHCLTRMSSADYDMLYNYFSNQCDDDNDTTDEEELEDDDDDDGGGGDDVSGSDGGDGDGDAASGSDSARHDPSQDAAVQQVCSVLGCDDATAIPVVQTFYQLLYLENELEEMQDRVDSMKLIS